MKAAVLFRVNQPLKVVEIPIPRLQEGQVLVKVAASGICHTQLLEMEGTHPTGDHTPNLLGHEGAGIVLDVGSGVNKVKKGDHVILSWIKGSGKNVLPKGYEYDGKLLNAGFVTTFNDHAIVSENRVTTITKEMPFKEAALLGCAVATGAGMVFNNTKIRSGQSIAVIGCGGIGISAIQAAAISGANPIIAVDLSDEKLEFVKKFGATHTLNSSKVDAKNEIDKITNGEGLDFAIEAVGNKSTMELAYNSVKKFGGKAILCGVPKPGLKIEIDPFPLYYKRQLVGTGGGETNPDVDFKKYCDMYLQGKLKLKEMITHTISLDEINKGFQLMKDGRCCRVVIDFKEK